MMSSYDDFSETFARSRDGMHWDEIDILLDFFGEKKLANLDIKILDIGCGSGRLLQHIRVHPGLMGKKLTYIGLDSSHKLLDEASKVEVPENIHTQFIHADMANMPCNEIGEVDCVFAIASFHHLMTQQDRSKTLELIRSVLRPEGYLLMTNWNLLSQSNLKKYKESITHTYDDGGADFRIKIGEHDRYYHAFTQDSLTHELENNHFHVISQKLSGEHRNIVTIAEI